MPRRWTQISGWYDDRAPASVVATQVLVLPGAVTS